MRDFKIYGELTLKFGNDYEVKLVLNKEGDQDYAGEELLEDYPLVGCEWIFKDGLSNVTRSWYGTSRFCGDSFLKHMYKIAQKKLRLEKEDNLFNPVLAALAGKRQLESILGNKYWQDHCQSGGLVVEMTASNGKLVRCKYQDILLRNPAISIDGGEYIDVWIAKMFLKPSEKRGQNIECNNFFGKLVYNIIKDIDSFSFLLDIMEECVGLEIEK
ncbi:MAG: hypothetical protein PUG54_04295 [Firmicutes bacterium]|nr:hypothetical protein [Bacillota bacterium]